MAMSLADRLNGRGGAGPVPIIAEIKRVIPALAGRPRDRRDAATLARLYESGGAVAVSVVTEATYFGGTPEIDLPDVLHAVHLPVIIKDFIDAPEAIDAYARLIESSAPGSLPRCTLLLIAHRAGRSSLARLVERTNHHGMQALVEVRGAEDLKLLRDVPGRPMISYNNKNIDVMETDGDGVRITREFVDAVRARSGNVPILSTSGHRDVRDIAESFAAGADAVLIGTMLLTSDDPGRLLADLTRSDRQPPPAAEPRTGHR